MPTYELTCSECGTRFERFLARMLRDEDKVCPNCGSSEVKQGIGGGYVAKAAVRPDSSCSSRGGFG
jgi:putative FmdB family regulatory protein